MWEQLWECTSDPELQVWPRNWQSYWWKCHSALCPKTNKTSLLKCEALAALTELCILNFIHKEKLGTTIITLTLYGVCGKMCGESDRQCTCSPFLYLSLNFWPNTKCPHCPSSPALVLCVFLFAERRSGVKRKEFKCNHHYYQQTCVLHFTNCLEHWCIHWVHGFKSTLKGTALIRS